LLGEWYAGESRKYHEFHEKSEKLNVPPRGEDALLNREIPRIRLWRRLKEDEVQEKLSETRTARE